MQDPDKIDVSFSILGEGSDQALKSFTEQMKGVKDHLAEINATMNSSFSSLVDNVRNLVDEMEKTRQSASGSRPTQGTRTDGASPDSSGTGSAHADASQAPEIDASFSRGKLGSVMEKLPFWNGARDTTVTPDTASRSFAPEGGPTPSNVGPGVEASAQHPVLASLAEMVAGHQQAAVAQERAAAAAAEQEAQPFLKRQFHKQMNSIKNNLGQGVQFTAGGAIYNAIMDTERRTMGTLLPWPDEQFGANVGRDTAAEMGNTLDGPGPFGYPGEVQDPFGWGIGFTMPGAQFFSPAGRETVKQTWQSWKDALGSGLTLDDTEKARFASNKLGWANREGEAFADAVKIVKQNAKGIDVEDIAQAMDQAFRNGWSDKGGPGKEIRRTADALLQLENISKKSRISVGELTRQMNSYIDAAQANGQYFGDARDKFVEAGRVLSANPKTQMINPQVIGALENNTLVQGSAMARYGIMPFNMGALPAGQTLDAGRDMMKMMYDMYSGSFRDMEFDTGEGFSQIVTKEQQIINAIQQSFPDMTADQIKAMLRGGDAYNKMTADGALDVGLERLLGQEVTMREGLKTGKVGRGRVNAWKDRFLNSDNGNAMSLDEMTALMQKEGMSNDVIARATELAQAGDMRGMMQYVRDEMRQDDRKDSKEAEGQNTKFTLELTEDAKQLVRELERRDERGIEDAAQGRQPPNISAGWPKMPDTRPQRRREMNGEKRAQARRDRVWQDNAMKLPPNKR